MDTTACKTASGPGTPHRILVVDDHPDTAKSYCELLTLMGHACIYRLDARDVMDAAREFRPDIALLDIGLRPELSGHQLAQMLRAEFGTRITLVAITAYGRDEDRVRTRKAGFDAHVTKPIEPPMLESIVGVAKLGLK